MLTDDQARHVCRVLDGNVIDMGWAEPAVDDARDGIRRRVRELRAEWLRAHLARLAVSRPGEGTG